jgi:hypothetical protein
MQIATIRFGLFAVAIMALVVLSSSFCSLSPASAQSGQTLSKPMAAINAVNDAFNAVVAAEKAGANVKVLLDQLNIASNLLAEAEMAYNKGDAELVASKSKLVLPIASQVRNDAVAHMNAGLAASQNAPLITVSLSIWSAAAFVASLFLVWRWLKKRYFENIFDAKPEVQEE